MRRLLVDVPVIVGSLLGVGTSAPQCLLIEGDALSLNGAENIGTKRAIAYRQRLRLPVRVGISGGVAGRDWLLAAGEVLRMTSIPDGLSA